MKTLRLASGLLLLFSLAAFATQSRVESMGKTTRFIVDDMSIFDNPAYINAYPNFLIGELGNYLYGTPASPGDGMPEAGTNRDPLGPWFGGLFALRFGENNAVSIGGVLNRVDTKLYSFFPDYIVARNGSFVRIPDPVTNFDGFLGARFGGFGMGAHIYIAHQDGKQVDGYMNNDAFASILQLDLGTTIAFSPSFSGDVSFGVIRMQYGPSEHKFLDTETFSSFLRMRFFSKLDAIGGHLIPAVSVHNYGMPGRDELDANVGIGLDAAFDKGFFWMGLNGFYNNKKVHDWYKTVNSETGLTYTYYNELDVPSKKAETDELWSVGGTVSFGIERKIWTDWFVVRVGGQKTIAYEEFKPGRSSADWGNSILCSYASTDGNQQVAGCQKGNYFTTNPVNDGTMGDNVGFGVGLNVEEKLKIDATVAEDFMFRNPFQGGGRIISRISATYSF